MTSIEEAARKTLAEAKEARAKSEEERAAMAKGRPTPTQDENDMAKLGAGVNAKEDDGSGPDRAQEEMRKRAEEVAAKRHSTRETTAEKPAGGGYQTRQSRSKSE
jgi:hypothetical protein